MKINASSLNLKYMHKILTGNRKGHFSSKILTYSAMCYDAR